MQSDLVQQSYSPNATLPAQRAGESLVCSDPCSAPALVSIGIIAWDEQDVVATLLKSLSAQILFQEVAKIGLAAEIVVVANGCTDATAQVATQALSEEFAPPAGARKQTPKTPSAAWKVADLPERGKVNAWNQFVHRLASPEARFLILMDADITLGEPETLWNILQALRQNPEASVCVDVPKKQLPARQPFGVRALSRSAGSVTAIAPGQLCGQLYCIRTDIARSIFLPKDLGACEDGFIKALVCTDLLTKPLDNGRICIAHNATHTFEAYTTPVTVLRNQKRKIIGQTIVHLLIDKHLPALSGAEKLHLADTLRDQDASDPDWLKRLACEHVSSARFPWQLYPGLLTHRFRWLARMKPVSRLACLPSLVSEVGISFFASCMAYKALKSGATDYWPKADRTARQ